MMKIALAGSSGLAQTFAYFLNETVHPFIILSRYAQAELEALGYQVAAVDYDNQEDLRYHLRGIDLVISTVSGASQINLIDAAAHSRVRRFIPAEFEGPPSRRRGNDPLDRGRAATLERLRHWSTNRHRMAFTVFSCGVFYERFAPGGLASKAIGASTGVRDQGSYLVNIGENTAEVVERNTAGQNIYLCMTSANDLARFLLAALELNPQTWPQEFRMRGDRLAVAQLVQYAETVKGEPFDKVVLTPGELSNQLSYSTYYQDHARVNRLQELVATEQIRYDYSQRQVDLNALARVQPTPFWDWLYAQWAAR